MQDSTNNDQPKRPNWIKAKAPQGENYVQVKALIDKLNLHTVCQSARCPNMGECWHGRTATFMILGDVCTRNCRFCAVTPGKPTELDFTEPQRVADAVAVLSLKHAVVTSVTRDDLDDGGAGIFAETIRAIKRQRPECSVEVLIPDFEGSCDNLKIVMDAEPDILNHNIETVPRMYRQVRPQAIYERSLELLKRAKEMRMEGLTKSGIMVGIGETFEEVLETMCDLRNVDCDILTIGQYLRPSQDHLPISRYYTPDEFAKLKEEGLAMGFKYVESAPLVRSSYHAAEQTVGKEVRRQISDDSKQV